jgi:hypothetical protein
MKMRSRERQIFERLGRSCSARATFENGAFPPGSSIKDFSHTADLYKLRLYLIRSVR